MELNRTAYFILRCGIMSISIFSFPGGLSAQSIHSHKVEDQLRRNHSTQYFSYPDYKFDRLRKEAAGQYESYADMGLNEWIKMKIIVKNAQAKLYLNDNPQPVLLVNDLKLGAGISGAIGLFVDGGTEGFFRDITVVAEN